MKTTVSLLRLFAYLSPWLFLMGTLLYPVRNSEGAQSRPLPGTNVGVDLEWYVIGAAHNRSIATPKAGCIQAWQGPADLMDETEQRRDGSSRELQNDIEENGRVVQTTVIEAKDGHIISQTNFDRGRARCEKAYEQALRQWEKYR